MNALSSTVRPLHNGWHYYLAAGLVVAALFLVGYWPRHGQALALAREASQAQRSLPRVKVVTASQLNGARSLALPGSLVAVRQALVYARATGYVTRWNVDIGDRVRAGDPLAELDTPELQQQLSQARAALKQKDAALEQARANLSYAQLTATRTDALLHQGLATGQDDDQANAQLKIGIANVHAAEADVAAADANLRELAQLVSFGHVVAPFDGRITQRNVDVGTLVSSSGGTSSSAGGQAMFRIEAVDPMRVFVQVPQTFALNVKPGQAASVAIRELPGRTFEGHVARTAGTIDPASRTLNTEIDIPNPKGELLGGMFAQVSIAVTLAHPVVRVPSSAVISDALGVHVATVDAAGRVRLLAVQRGVDDGRELDLVDGLAGGEQVMVNPPADVAEGMRVEALH
ncbi:MAG TPA: efflux RND transporter periplasmic adaptor subunit [Polyangiaceae bacterium]|jgi:RND family efflux transporter MFP subunit